MYIRTLQAKSVAPLAAWTVLLLTAQFALAQNPPTLTKSFSPSLIPINGTSTVTLSVTNPNTVALNGVVIHDALPSNLAIANPDGFSATGPCTAGISGISAGSTAFTYSLAPMAAGVTCTFNANVVATTNGTATNTATVDSANGAGAPATATLNIQQCDSGVLAGRWSFKSSGTTRAGNFTQAGNFTGNGGGLVLIVSTNDNFNVTQDEQASGKFQINPDCSGGTMSFFGSHPVTYEFWFVNGFNNVNLISVGSSLIASGDAAKAAKQ